MLYDYTRNIHGSKYPISNDIRLKGWLQHTVPFIAIRDDKEKNYTGYRINVVYAENRERAKKFVVSNKGKPGYKDFLRNLNSNYARSEDPMFSFEGIMLEANSRLHL